jgi:zinc transporter ZupT
MALIGLAAFAFFHILLNPSSDAGYLADSERTSMATVIGLLLVFGLGSVLFWAYFRFVHKDHPAAPPTPPPAAFPPATG